MTLLRRLAQAGVSVRIDGEVLRVRALGAAIDPVLLDELRKRRDYVVDLLKRHEDAAVPGAPFNDEVHTKGQLSHGQRRMWFMEKLRTATASYNVPVAFRLRGDLAWHAFEQAFGEVVRRHAILRTHYPELAGYPTTRTSNESSGLLIPVLDMSGITPRADHFQSMLQCEAERPFDLAAGPVFRLLRVIEAPNRNVVLFAIHHIAFDGYSMSVLAREVEAAMQAFVAGRPLMLDDLALQYADAMQEQSAAASLDRGIEYWKQQLERLPALRWPAAPSCEATPAIQVSTLMTESLQRRLHEFASQEVVTVFTVACAALQVLLAQRSGQLEFGLATDIAGRDVEGAEGLIGFFANQVVLRADLRDRPSLRELCRRVARCMRGGLQHSAVPYDSVVAALISSGDRGASLSRVKLVMQPSATTLRLPDANCSAIPIQASQAKFDVLVNVFEREGRLVCACDYRDGCMSAADATAFLADYVALIDLVCARPSAGWDELLSCIAARQTARRAAVRAQVGELRASRLRELLAVKLNDVPAPVEVKASDVASGLKIARALPLVIVNDRSDSNLRDWIERHHAKIEDVFSCHGAVAFRGFELDSPEDFGTCGVALTASGQLMDYIENTSPRTTVLGKIKTSTDYPASQPILLHNEHSYSRSVPQRLLFACKVAPPSGGATLLADCRRVLSSIPDTIRADFAARGWMYVRNFRGSFGPSWQSVFETSSELQVSKHCREADVDCEWLEAGALTLRHRRSAIVTHPRTREQVWFNHVAFWHLTSLEPSIRAVILEELAEDEFPNQTYYGDGASIAPEVVGALRSAYEEQTVAFEWRAGDLLVIDNLLVAHGRQPFEPPRLVWFAMADRIDRRCL